MDMALTVLDATKLNIFENFRLVAGHRGLDRIIQKVGILDWEYIEKTESGSIDSDFVKGEFVLSSLLFAKENPEYIMDAVKYLEESEVSGLAIKNVYYQEIPHEVIRYADERSFPIFIFSKTYFEDIVTEITDRIKSINNYESLETKIDLLVKMNLNKAIVRDVAFEINSGFKECFFILYFKEKRFISDDRIISMIERLKKSNIFKSCDAVLKYKKGILTIFTYDKLNHADFRKKVNYYLGVIDLPLPEFFTGVSDLHAGSQTNLYELGKGINESLFAERTAEVNKDSLSFFSEIGIYSILMPSHNDIWLQNFYKDFITPIIQHDQKYNTELLDTAMKYVENDGKIIETADALFIHKNTLRYRINKIKELLNMEESELSFLEQLSISVKLHKIYQL